MYYIFIYYYDVIAMQRQALKSRAACCCILCYSGIVGNRHYDLLNFPKVTIDQGLNMGEVNERSLGT